MSEHSRNTKSHYDENHPQGFNPFVDSTKEFRFFPSLGHRRSAYRIISGLKSRCGLVLLTGEIGSGKTTLCRHIQQEWSEEFFFSELGNPFLSPAEQISHFLKEFGLDYQGLTSLKERTDALYRFFRDQHERRRPPVLILDETHLLTHDHFRQLLVFSNLHHNGQPLVQMLLVGQLELMDRLLEPGLEAFSQRIGVRCKLEPLSFEDTRRYIEFKLNNAAMADTVGFEDQSMKMLWQATGGLPRLINHACANLLDHLAFSGEERITPKSIQNVINGEMYQTLFPKKRRKTPAKRFAWLAASLALGLLLFTGGWLFTTSRHGEGPGRAGETLAPAALVRENPVASRPISDRSPADQKQKTPIEELAPLQDRGGDAPASSSRPSLPSTQSPQRPGKMLASKGVGGESRTLDFFQPLPICTSDEAPPKSPDQAQTARKPPGRRSVSQAGGSIEKERHAADASADSPPAQQGSRAVLAGIKLDESSVQQTEAKGPLAAASETTHLYNERDGGEKAGGSAGSKTRIASGSAAPPSEGGAPSGQEPAGDSVAEEAPPEVDGNQGASRTEEAASESQAEDDRPSTPSSGPAANDPGQPPGQGATGKSKDQIAASLQDPPPGSAEPGAAPPGDVSPKRAGEVAQRQSPQPPPAKRGDQGSSVDGRVLDGREHPVVGKLIVEAIAYFEESGHSMAVVNESIMRENDRLGSIRLDQIFEDYLVFSYQGKKYKVPWSK